MRGVLHPRHRGALGLHRAGVVQYLRPEIPGFILGAFLAAFLSREYQPRSGSSPVVRFFLGFFAMIGALIFLGCPWRAYARLAGGDWNAIAGIGGLTAGIGVGIIFLWNGFSLGRAANPLPGRGPLCLLPQSPSSPFFTWALSAPGGPGLSFSKSGPGLPRRLFSFPLGWGLRRVDGPEKPVLHRGALRDLIMLRNGHLFSGVAAFLVSAFVVNLLLGQFRPEFESQPVAHTNQLWNFIGMALSGFASLLREAARDAR